MERVSINRLPPIVVHSSDECLKRANKVLPEPRGGAAGGMMTNSSILHLSHGFSQHSYSDVYTYNARDHGWEMGEKLRH